MTIEHTFLLMLTAIMLGAMLPVLLNMWEVYSGRG